MHVIQGDTGEREGHAREGGRGSTWEKLKGRRQNRQNKE